MGGWFQPAPPLAKDGAASGAPRGRTAEVRRRLRRRATGAREPSASRRARPEPAGARREEARHRPRRARILADHADRIRARVRRSRPRSSRCATTATRTCSRAASSRARGRSRASPTRSRRSFPIRADLSTSGTRPVAGTARRHAAMRRAHSGGRDLGPLASGARLGHTAMSERIHPWPVIAVRGPAEPGACPPLAAPVPLVSPAREQTPRPHPDLQRAKHLPDALRRRRHLQLSASRPRPAWSSASTTAFIAAGVAPIVPSSPTPLTPSGLSQARDRGVELGPEARRRRRRAAPRSP